jgi:prepilin-type N-terminal cleavage/methylation domain-containing protein
MRNERIREPRRGFTLIELLVVVSVIALLIGILLPALGAARRQAVAVSCASNLKQLGLGIGMYYNDYPSTLPQVRVNGAGDMVRPGDVDQGENIGALFGGKKGLLPFIGIDRIGAERVRVRRRVAPGRQHRGGRV